VTESLALDSVHIGGWAMEALESLALDLVYIEVEA
jgi:hypothetical protein